MLSRFLILTFIITLASCSNNRQRRKDIVADKIIMINENRSEWEKLTKAILSDSFVNQQLNKFISPEQLNNEIKEKLEKNGVVRISVQKQENCNEVEYATDWTEYPVGAFYLTWTTCDSVQTKKGYYRDNFNENFIEVWGAGNNWLIWTDSDFI